MLLLQIMAGFTMLVLFLLFWSRTAYAECAPNPDLGPLLQTTNDADEYRGLVKLDLLCTEEAPDGNVSKASQNVMPSVVQIKEGNYWGSGCILDIGDDYVILVSNKHLLIHRNYSAVYFYNGKMGLGKALWLSPTADLGFAKVDISDWSYEDRRKLRKIRINDRSASNLKRGDRIFMIGSSDGVACNVSHGTVANPLYYVAEFGSDMVYNYCKAKPGMSGGGTFNEYGHYIGMITGGAQDETVSVPVRMIEEAWKDYDKN